MTYFSDTWLRTHTIEEVAESLGIETPPVVKYSGHTITVTGETLRRMHEDRMLWQQHIDAHRRMLNYPTRTPKETPVPNPSTLRREAAALLAEAERLENCPPDDYSEGTVITFTKPGRFVGSEWPGTFIGGLKYAAIKAGDRAECWFLTGKTRQGKTWEQLLDFIGDENLHTARSTGAARGAPIVPRRRKTSGALR